VTTKQPSLLSLLGGRGLHDLERARPEEQLATLRRLMQLMQRQPGPPATLSTSSGARIGVGAQPAAEATHHDHSTNEDHREWRFREPAPSPTASSWTGVRIIAVEPGTACVLWSLHQPAVHAVLEIIDDNEAWTLPDGAAFAHPHHQLPCPLATAQGAQYVQVPRRRASIRVRTHNDDDDTSNTTWLMVDEAAGPGQLWWASIPLHIDRRRLAGGGAARGEHGVELSFGGEAVARGRVLGGPWSATSSSRVREQT
jgi:hypothetical protein